MTREINIDKYKGHTPGPWIAGHFTDEGHSCECRWILSESYCGSIAEVSVCNGIKSIGKGGNDSPPLKEAQANVRLIADAPLLLEEVKRLREVINAAQFDLCLLHEAILKGDEKVELDIRCAAFESLLATALKETSNE